MLKYKNHLSVKEGPRFNICHSLIGLISHDHMPSPSLLVLYWCTNMHNWMIFLCSHKIECIGGQVYWTHIICWFLFLLLGFFFTAWSIVLDDPDEVHRSKHVRNTAVLYTTNITADETSLVVKKLPIATLKIRLIQQFTLIQNSLSSKMRLDGNMVLLQ